jgi:hypothetical protein
MADLEWLRTRFEVMPLRGCAQGRGQGHCPAALLQGLRETVTPEKTREPMKTPVEDELV